MSVVVDHKLGKRLLKNFTPPEGVPLQFTLASMGARFGAQILDILITYGALLLVVLAVAQSYLMTLSGFVVLLLFALFFVRVPYYVFSELVWNGRTLGKRIVKIRVISADGTRLTPYQITARNVLKEVEVFLPVTVLFGAGDFSWWVRLGLMGWMLLILLVPFLNTRRQRLGDMVAGTLVVEQPQARLMPDLTEQNRKRQAARFVFSPEQLSIYGRFELQTLETILRNPPVSPASRRNVENVVRTIRRKIDYPDRIAAADEWEFLTEFYRSQRAFLESRQLFGDSRENKFHDQDKPGPDSSAD